MNETGVAVTLKKGWSATKVEGSRVAFSSHQCFLFDNNVEDIDCLRALGTHLIGKPGLVLYGRRCLVDYLLQHVPELKTNIVGTVYLDDSSELASGYGISSIKPAEMPAAAETVFLCETLYLHRAQMRKHLRDGIAVIDLAILADIAPEVIPARGWSPVPNNIYPLDFPEIGFKDGQDFIIVDCPSRNLALMPNGLGYLNNALKKTTVVYQIFDLDIVAYHRYHCHRLFDTRGQITLPSGRVLPEDPWLAEHYDIWSSGAETSAKRGGDNEVIAFFRLLIDETVDRLVEARPKILGLSIQQCNEAVSREIVRGTKVRIPELIVVVGGFSCYNADIGLKAFPDADYMCIGESDMTAGPLVEALARGERPKNQPGVLSRFDTPDYRYIPAPMIHNLDQIEFPKYEWCNLDVYRNFNDYQLTPIIASRGCRWSRCTFCAERFYWRIRTPENFADELEWLVDQGCHLFMFNESDLNGMPERVMEICDEIIRRGLHKRVKLTGQLRIHKKSDKAFFLKLREANFVALRFGVDAFSANTLRLQKKGYTVDMVRQNLKDCWEAGIFTEVNWVIGVPGETDQDVEEGIQLILENTKYIGRLANINPLIMVNGGVYWIDPDAHNIKFKEPKDDLYAKFPRALPADTWYSTEPYIDAQVRKERFERIVLALHESGFHVGAWAHRVIEDVKLARDPNRSGGGKKAVAVDDVDEAEVALAAGSQRSPYPAQSEAPYPENANERRVISLVQSDEDGSAPEAKRGLKAVNPAPPPRLVRYLEAHDLFAYDGAFYGVPHTLGIVDLADTEVAKNSAIVKRSTEPEVVAAIEENIRWANSRGQYDDQEQQRTRGSYMRVNSMVGGDNGPVTIAAKPAIFRHGGQFIAIERDVLNAAFNGGESVADSIGKDDPRTKIVQGTSLMRRIATKLPLSLQYEIRRLLHHGALADGGGSGPLVTQKDGRLVLLLGKTVFDSFVRQPLTRMLKHKSESRQEYSNVIELSGTKYAVITVTTKDAVPELMWTIGNYNVVKFDGFYYGLPHGLAIDWDDNVAEIPGVIFDRSVKAVVATIDSGMEKPNMVAKGIAADIRPTISQTAPILLGSVEDYNIVSYEGWVYGLPQSLGPIDLTEVDAMEMAGVIRDVSHYAVENEVMERHSSRQSA